MATVFSTATLGLSIDTKQFNKDLKSAQSYTQQALTSMGQVADTFSDRWDALTGGLKDTKRIISGILVSQGFYALSNALLNAGGAALTFSMNMETAAVSLEYFVDAAEGTEEAAAEVQAYLREVNNFAARTPFSTEDVLTLSKYMQAVGVAMGQTQSVLSVITDTAAATGASTEQLQRVTFALGQILTKGRLANEEIRQLANANIPIYQILQEELGLTGDQISKIGNYWIDSNEAVVAILNGLNKRYAGAADKIAETFTGLSDTIVDDLKIISSEAFDGLYNRLTGAAGTLRDMLDEWRTIVTEQGAMGLFDHLLMSVDPTGEVGNQILSIIGNIRQLKDSFIELYISAKPVISVVGQTFNATLNASMITLTAFADVLNDVITFLDNAGVSTQVLVKGLASLYVAYKATQLMSLFGQACWSAGQSAYSAVNAIMALLPASLTASTGVRVLTASVATLIAYAVALAGIFGSLNSSFAGLDTSGGGIANDYTDEYTRYAAAMEEYNKKIEAYQGKYREDYSNMAGDKKKLNPTEDGDDDKDSSSSSAGGGTKSDWVAAFDEVYDVPDEDSTGTYQDAVLADLGELLNTLRTFKFPDLSSLTLEKPEFDWDKVYDGSLWDNAPLGISENFWKWFLPSAIAGGTIALGKIFAKQHAKLSDDIVDVLGKGNLGGTIVSDTEAAKAVAALTKKYEQGTEQLLRALDDVKRSIRTIRELDSSASAYAKLGQDTVALDRLNKSVSQVADDLAYYGKQLNTKFTQSISKQEINASLLEANKLINEHGYNQLVAQLADTADPYARSALLNAIEDLNKSRDVALPGMPASVSTADEYADALDEMGRKLYKKLDDFGKKPFTKPTKLTRSYDDATLREISSELSQSKAALDRYIELYRGTDYYRETIVETLHKQLGSLNAKYLKLYQQSAEAATNFNAYAAAQNDLARINNSLSTEARAAAEKQATKLLDQATSISRNIAKLEPEALAANVAAREAALKKIAEDTAAQRVTAEKGRAEAAAARKQQAAEAAQGRRTARANAYNAAIGQGAVAPTKTAGVTELDEKAAATAHRLAELQDELDGFTDALNDFKLQGDAEQVKRIQRSIDSTRKEIATLRGEQNSSLTKIERQVGSLSSKQASLVEQVASDLQGMLPKVPGMAEQTATATAAWKASIQPAIVDALAANGVQLDMLRMTATKTITAVNGLSDYGKTMPQLIAEAFKDAGLFTKNLPNAADPALSELAERGVVLEKYFGSAADVSLAAHNVTVYQGGHAASPKSSLIVQYDFAAGGMDKIISGAADTVALDIKVTGADTVRAIESLSSNVTDNIFKADADILRQVGRNDNYYELMAQSHVFTGKNGGQLIGFADADFDYDKVIKNFAETLKRQMSQVFNNSAFDPELLEKMSGRIFSMDAFRQAQKLSGKGSTYGWNQYEADVVAPIFQNPLNQFNADALAKSFKLIYLDYSNALRSIDLDAIANQYTKMLSVFGVLGDSGEKYLTSFAKVMGYSEDIVGALDMSAALKNYPAAARSMNKWLQAILRDSDVMVTAGSVPKLFRQSIDKIVSDYVTALSSGAEDATAVYTAKIKGLRKNIAALQSGKAIPDDLANMFGRMAKSPAKYAHELRSIDEALAVLESTPSDVNKITSSIISVRTQMNRLKRAAATGTPVMSRQITGLISAYEQAVNYLHLGTNQVAIDVGNQLQALQRYIAGQGGEAIISSAWTKNINLPMAFADVGTSTQLVAASIADGLNNGLLHMGQNAHKALLEALGNIQPGKIVDNLLPQLMEQLNTAVGKTLIVDLETAGLPTTSELGTHYPAITQATVADQQTGKMVSSYITSGDVVQDAANLYKMQSLTNADGTMSDVAKAWQKVTLDDISGGMTIQQFWTAVQKTFGTGNTGTGWNAFGVTGFDYPIMRANGMPDNLLLPGEDLMTRFSNIVQQATGVSKKFKLVDAYETIFGQFEEAAHLADSDVEMARRVANAMQDGTLAKILEGFDDTAEGSAVAKLKAAGEAYRNSIAGAADTITDATAGAAKTVKEAAEPIADAVNDAVGAATKEAADSASKISFKEIFDRISRKAVDNVSELFKSLWQPAETLKERFAAFKNNASFFGSVDTSVFKKLPLDEVIDSWANAANDLIDVQNKLKAAKLAGSSDDVISALEEQVAKLSKAYDLAGTNLYKTLVTQTSEALHGADDITDTFTKYVSSIARNDDYIAFYYDAAAKQFKTIGSQINISGDELLKRLSNTVTYADDVSDYASKLFNSVKAGTVSFSDAAKEMDNLVSFAKLTGNKNIAGAFEKLSNAFKGIGDIDEAISTYATVLKKTFAENADDVTAVIADAVKSLKNGGTLTAEGFEVFADAINKQVGDTVVIINKATGNLEFAGKTAASAIDDAASGVSDGLSALSKKVFSASIGTFSVFDAIGVGIDAALEAYNVSKLQGNIGSMINQLVGDDTRDMFTKAGVDLKKTLGDSVYSGITTAFTQSVVVTLMSNAIGTAAGAAAAAVLASGPAGWIAAGVAALAGVGLNLAYNATGGNTATNKYAGNYEKAVASGKYIDYDSLVKQLTDAGYSIESATKAANAANDAAHQFYQREIVQQASSGNMWERGKVEKWLYGNASMYGNASADNEALRIAQTMGLIDVKAYSRADDRTADVAYTELVVREADAAKQLAEIKDVLDDQSLTLGEAVTINGETYRYVMRNDKHIGYDSSNLDMLADALDMVTTQGTTTGSVAESILSTINNNDALSEAYDAEYGNLREAQNILSEFLKTYNAANGTDYTAAYLDENGLAKQFLQSMIDIYEAQSAVWYNEATIRGTTDTKNRKLLAGDTSTMLANIDSSGWAASLLNELRESGLSFTSGSYHVDTAFGSEDVPYTVLSTELDALRENLAGVRVGTTTLADGTVIDASKLMVSAADAEILAEAGIQINSDGTITFMNAMNEGVTGAERDLTLTRDAFSQSILRDLQTNAGISLDFDTKELDFGDFSKITKNMSSALFSMPSNINDQLNDDMKRVINKIGKITDSGYLQITNKAILSGKQTIRQFIEAAGQEVDDLSPQVYSSLMSIDALIQKGGGTISENILEWANGVVVPSPISAAKLTPEIEAAFKAIGISFETQGNQLMMVINQTGEKLTNGITLISADKWMSLDQGIRDALTALGVTATQYGNDMMIDLNGVMDSGIANIVSLFVDQPDLWNQIPESIRDTLEASGIITHDQLIEIQNTLSGGLVTITDGWVASWDKLGPEVTKSLNEAGLNTQTGLAEIHKYVGDADVGTMLDEGVVVYFDDLPADVQEAMNATGENLRGCKVTLQTATDTAVGGMLDVLKQTTTDISDETAQWKTLLDEALSYQQRLSKIDVGSSYIHNASGKATYTSNNKGQYIVRYNKQKYTVQATSLADAIKQIKDYYGIDLSNVKTEPYATGGTVTGNNPVLAGELGDELAILPDGTTKLVGAGLYDMPAGTQVINAADTADILKYAGNVRSIKKLADGNTTLTVDPYGEETTDTADSKDAYADFIEIYRPVLNEELSAVAELVATALDNSAKIIAEELKATKNAAGDNTSSIISSITEAAASITGGLSGLQSSLSSTMSSLRSNYSSLGMGASKTSSSMDRSGLTGSVYDKTYFTDSELKAADSLRKAAEAGETSWKEAHDFVETIRNSYGYTGGTDGSKYIKDSGSAGKKIKANAFGGLATGDQLVRVGEFGKDEAILPLEQPSVMAQVGEAVGQYVGGITADELTVILDNELYTLQTQLSVALDNSAKIIAEELAENARSDAQNASDIKAALDGAISSLSEGLTSIKDELGSLGSSISNAMSSLSSLSKGSNLAGDTGSSGSLDRKSVTGSAYDKAHFTDSELAAADSLRKAAEAGEATWKEAHSFVESIRNSYGYSGGTDGSKYIKSTDKASSGKKIKANAYGGLITDDSLVRVGEYGKEEAVLPLEQPSVMAKLGTSIGKYTVKGTALTDEDIQALHSIFYTVVDEQTTQLSVALDNSAKILGESISGLGQDTRTFATDITTGLTGQTDALKAALSDLGSSISSSIGSMASSISSAVSSAARANLAGSNLAGGAGAGSGGSGIDRSQYGGSVYDQAHFTDSELKAAAGLRDAATAGKISWSDAHKGVESIRNNYGYSGGTDGSKYNKKTKGSAKGSLVTEDALYRAGELGLNEAIIPLEKPEIMKYVGSTIASYMPVEAAGLEEALGMKNAGIAPTQRAANPYETDMTGLVNKVTQSVLESVLPAMSSMQSSNDATTPVYVGTLIADERGLKQLERKLYTIRKADEARRQ